MKTSATSWRRHSSERGSTLPTRVVLPGPIRRMDGHAVVVSSELEERSEIRWCSVLNGAAIGIAVVDELGRVLESNKAFQRMLGYEAGELSQLTISSLVSAEGGASGECPYQQIVAGVDDRIEVERRFLRRDGQPLWCHLTAAAIPDSAGHPGQVVVTLEDTTERRWMAEALQESERQLRAVVEQARDGMFIGTVDGLVIMYNRAMETISGYSMMETNEHGWFDLVFKDPARRAYVTDLVGKATEGVSGATEAPIIRKDGEMVWIALSFSLIVVGGQQFVLGVVTDITKGKLQEERLTYLATHDGLTGLPNRRTIVEMVTRELARSRRYGAFSSLMFADLDNFKTVNDTLGHSAGDEVLISLTQLLRSKLRAEDVLARLGGDEFAVLVSDATSEGARAAAERLRRSVDEYRFTVGNQTFHLGLSIGVAPVTGQPSAEMVLSQADAAMYQAKSQGRNRVVLWECGEAAVAGGQPEGWASRLRDVLESGSLVACYQPLVSLSDGALHSFSVRPYLRADGGELIPPGGFVPDAERLGLMPQITRWLIGRVIEEMQARPGTRVSISLPAPCLASDELLEYIEGCAREGAFDPRCLGFRVAETSVTRALTVAERWLQRLKALGCYLALNDFGSGLSSFLGLRSLPVDLLMIDSAITRKLGEDPGNLVVVKAIQSLASLMGKEVGAKSVNSEAVCQLLREAGVTYGIGDFLGRPSPETVAMVGV